MMVESSLTFTLSIFLTAGIRHFYPEVIRVFSGVPPPKRVDARLQHFRFL